MIVTRFAPSPTGELHLGGLRTALYNYLLARGGPPGSKFLIRIEDTDQKRLVSGATDRLLGALRRTGLEPAAGSPVLVQSTRLPVYEEHATQLLQTGHAYRCFCSHRRIRQARLVQQSRGGPPGYDRFCLGLTPDTVQRNLDRGVPFVVRLKVPHQKGHDSPDTMNHGATVDPSVPGPSSSSGGHEVTVHDLVRGPVSFDCRHLDDPVLLKSDGFPTYHLANVVDDRLQGITHVIRGEEWLSSAPKHVLLYNAFGWAPPAFAHLPLLLNADGSKFSKRSAAAGSMTVDGALDRLGVEPQALVNFVARLGCTLGTDGDEDDRVLSMDQLAEQFDLAHVHKGGAAVSEKKLMFFNRRLLQAVPAEELAQRLQPLLAANLGAQPLASPNPSVPLDRYLCGLVDLFREHTRTLVALACDALFLFRRPEYSSSPAVSGALAECLRAVAGKLQQEDRQQTLASDAIGRMVKLAAAEHGLKTGKVLVPFRVALTGTASGPPLYPTAALLGAQECADRLSRFLEQQRTPTAA